MIMKISTLVLALITLIAFTANSILCRLALISNSIGPVEFTLIRLGSGLIILLPIVLFRKHFFGFNFVKPSSELYLFRIRLSNFLLALSLFGYAIFFSLAYVQLDAGTGALILFGSVQITMIGVSIILGNKISLFELIGVLISFSGLVYLMLPNISAPPVFGTLMMVISGMAWGIYSLLGKRQTQPILSTARNFLFCLPGVIILALLLL